MYINFILPVILATVAIAQSNNAVTTQEPFMTRFNTTCGQISFLFNQAMKSRNDTDAAREKAFTTCTQQGPFGADCLTAFDTFSGLNKTFTKDLNTYEDTKENCLSTVCGNNKACKENILNITQ
jgi:hypothetical protein